MIVTVQLFARARDLAGTNRTRLDLPAGATVGDVRRELARTFPALAGLVERSALAMNEEFAEDREAVLPGAELALLPPVSGG